MLAIYTIFILHFSQVLFVSTVPTTQQPSLTSNRKWQSQTRLSTTNVTSSQNVSVPKPLILPKADQDQAVVLDDGLQMGDVQFAKYDDESKLNSTKAPLIDYLIRWGLFAAMLLTPLILIPILFLFLRGTSSNSPEEGSPQEENQASQVGHLHFGVKLVPVCVAKHSPPIVPNSCWLTKGSFYYVTANVGVVYKATGLLLHPPSGLAFVPLHGHKFNSKTQLCVNIQDGNKYTPGVDKVYNSKSYQLYEICRGLGYDTLKKRFFLPEAQETTGDSCSFRRLKTSQLPPEFQIHYKELLRNEQKKRQRMKAEQLLSETEKSTFKYAIAPIQKSDYHSAVSELIGDAPV